MGTRSAGLGATRRTTGGKRRGSRIVGWFLWAMVAAPFLSLQGAAVSEAGSPASVVEGASYYVATSGDNTGEGTTPSSAWRTIQHAVDRVEPGDTIHVLPGTYAGARIERSGVKGARITLRAQDGGTVTLNAPGGANRHGSILEVETWEGSRTVSYWVIQGFEIAGSGRYGVDIRNGHHITVRGNHVHHSAVTGIFTAFSDDVTISGNESNDNGEHGIYHSNSGDRAVLRGNLLHHNYGCGIHMNGDLSMGGDGILSECVVENNIIYENGTGGGSAINMDGVVHSMIRNNLLYKNHSSGISLYQIDGAVCSNHNRVLHNTVLVPSDGRWAVNIPGTGCTHNELFNNILFNAHSWRGSITVSSPNITGFSSDYNTVVNRFSTNEGDTTLTLQQWQTLGYDTHSFHALPEDLFQDSGGDDYHLKAGSPAIDAGTPLPDVSEDMEGQARPTGGGPDLGAYEFKAAWGESPKEFLAAASIPDCDGNGSEEVAVLSRNKKTGISMAEVRDGASGERIAVIRFFGPEFQPFGIAAAGDMDGNGAAEIAVAAVQQTTQETLAQVRDSSTGKLVSRVSFGTSFAPKNLTTLEDMNGNGAPELAVLETKIRNGASEVTIKDGLTGSLIKRIPLK